MTEDDTRKSKWRRLINVLNVLGYIGQRHSGTVGLHFKKNGDITVELFHRRPGHDQIKTVAESNGLVAQNFEGKVLLHMRNGGVMGIVKEERES